MKKSILVSAAILMTITAFAFVKLNKTNPDKKNETIDSKKSTPEAPLPFYFPKPTDIYYNLGTRFGAIKKTSLHKAISVRDFFTEHVNGEIHGIESANIIVIIDDEHSNIQAANDGEQLSPEQLKLLRNCDYSTNLKISTDVKTKSGYVYYSPHLTVVPQVQANYSLGKEAFIEYLKTGNKKNASNIMSDKLGFAKLAFTVNKDGSISNLDLDHSSGYKRIDDAMFELLKNAPGKWTPAINAEGEHVAQELVISFGKEGC